MAELNTIPPLPLKALLAALTLTDSGNTGLAVIDAGDVVGRYYNGTRTVPQDVERMLRSCLVQPAAGGLALRVSFSTATENATANEISGDRNDVAVLARSIYEAEDGLPCLLVFLIAA